MTYCPRWVSDYTYRAVRDWLEAYIPQAALATQRAGTAQAQDVLAVTGIVNTETLTAALDYAYRTTITDTLPAGQGAYTFELQDSSQQVLRRHSFDLDETNESGSNLRSIAQLIPYDPATDRILLKKDEDVLATMSVSSNAPQVEVLSPNGGEVPSGTTTVRWTASDADGDDLRYVVRYSVDGGVTWRMLAHDLATTSYGFDTSQVAGSAQALIQVIASDGVRTGQDQSDAVFSVSRKGPEAAILWPPDGTRLLPGVSVLLEGYGDDLEDGPLADPALTWTSNKDGGLGAGGNLRVDRLSVGEHLLTLQVKDGDGNTAAASVTVVVGPRLYFPVVSKG
jgi:hypothetical protein